MDAAPLLKRFGHVRQYCREISTHPLLNQNGTDKYGYVLARYPFSKSIHHRFETVTQLQLLVESLEFRSIRCFRICATISIACGIVCPAFIPFAIARQISGN